MKLDEIKLSYYKYKVKTCTLTYGKKPKLKKYSIDNNLLIEMQITENYDNEIFPFFTMTFAVPSKIYRELVKPANKKNIKVNLHIQKGKFTDSWKLEDIDRVSFKDAIKGNFQAVIGTREVDMTEKEQKIIEKSGYEYGQFQILTMSLYLKKYYDVFQTVVNANLENVNLTDAMIYLLNKAKIKNVLMTPSNSKKKYSQFLILPIQAYKMIARICDKYRFHNKGSIIFFAFDRLYIIDKSPQCNAYVENEYKVTYIVTTNRSQTLRVVGGAYTNEQKKYYVVNALGIAPNDDAEITKKIRGNNTISINEKGKITKTNKKATKVTSVVVQNEGSNSAKAIKRQLKESKKTINCQLQNLDISMIKPNKQFVVSIEGNQYKKYNGKYRVKLCTHAFSKEGDYFDVSSILQLSSH